MGNTINLATKYAAAAQERFYKDSFTQSSFSKDLDMEFTGVRTVRSTRWTPRPSTITPAAAPTRYGTPQELTDNLQEYIMTQDKAFTYTIDKGNAREQFNVKQAGASLKRQLREVVTPYIDRYRMNVWAQKAGIITALTAAPRQVHHCGPDYGRHRGPWMKHWPPPRAVPCTSPTPGITRCSSSATNFSPWKSWAGRPWPAASSVSSTAMAVKKVPSSYMPKDVYFMIVTKGSAISPMKLNDYKIHSDPPGISVIWWRAA